MKYIQKNTRKRHNRKRHTRKRFKTIRDAGVVPFFYKDETKFIKHKYKKYYDYDCLAQCFYALRYTNYKNSILLQKISQYYQGITYDEVSTLLNNAFNTTSHKWKHIEPDIYGEYVDSSFYDILMDNDATLCFLETPDVDEINHYVIVFRRNYSIMIRDPQSNYTTNIHDYLYYRNYINIYLLIDNNKIKNTDDGVKREHICELFNCELIEYKDIFFKKDLKKQYKKTMKITNQIPNEEPIDIYNPIKRSNSNNSNNYNRIWNAE